VLMLQNAIYTPISPERAAVAELRDSAAADQVVGALRLTSIDSRRMGVIDEIVREPDGGAHTDPMEASRLLKRALMIEITDVVGRHGRTLVRRRHRKYRNIGESGRPFRSALRRELNVWRSALSASVRMLRSGSDPGADVAAGSDEGPPRD